MIMTYGEPIVFGVEPEVCLAAIHNIPEGAKVRIRMRMKTAVKVFVKLNKTISMHYLLKKDGFFFLRYPATSVNQVYA